MNKITPPAAPLANAISLPAPSPAPVFKALAAAGLIAPFLSHGAIITVGTTDAENATVCTLRDAGRAVSAPGNVFGGCAVASVGASNEVRFGANVVGTITYSDTSNVFGAAGAELSPVNDLSIIGPGASTLAVSCTPNAVISSMIVIPSSNAVSSVNIAVSGLTFRDCASADPFGSFVFAGGLNVGNAFGTTNVVSGVTLSNLVVTGNSGSLGGLLGVANNAGLQANRLSVEGNFGAAIGGAALFAQGGDTRILNSTFAGNTGGGISGVYGAAISGDLSVDNITVSGNAIVPTGSMFTFPALSAATFLSDGNTGISHSTIVRNTAINVTAAVGLYAGAPDFGSGMGSTKSAAIDAKALTVPMGLNNSIVCGNDVADAQGNVIANFNLLGVIAPGSQFAGTGNVNGCTGAQLNNWLSPLANNGGPTRTHALINVPGNPAINSGDPGFSGAPTDQTGINPRAFGRTDMGAFEVAAAAADAPNIPVPTASAAGLGALSVALAALGMRRRKGKRD
jgi:IPTL-CTERM motif